MGKKEKKTTSGIPIGVCESTWVTLTFTDNSDSPSERPLSPAGVLRFVALEEEALTVVR